MSRRQEETRHIITDYVIIGGGISGLYTAQLLEKKHPSRSISLYESNNIYGGRAQMTCFHNTNIVQGAGVGRFGKDKILYQLWKSAIHPEKPQVFSSKIQYIDFEPIDTLQIIQNLKTKRDAFKYRHDETFKTFFLRHYSRKTYQQFIWTNGFSDFEKADIIDTLYDYGFEDNLPSTSFFRIDWNKLVQYLVRCLQRTRLFPRHKVTSVQYIKDQGYYRVRINGRTIVYSRNVIWAGHFKNGYHDVTQLDIESQIGYNPFLRYYIFCKNKIEEEYIGKSYHRTDNLQKTIVINEHVVLLSYSDNQKAIHSHKELKRKNSVSFFWSHGTHYYKPLSKQWSNRREFIHKMQHPQKGCFLVGELISTNQGWTEGALESVHSIFAYL